MKKNRNVGVQPVEKAWLQFVGQEELTEKQAAQFKCYISLLRAWNKRVNLTRITIISAILTRHFQDSLRVAKFIDISSQKRVCDVGTGAGFPGVPINIMYPDVPMVLLEVNQKKIAFLQELIKELELKNCVVCDLDWRTFLRQAPYEVDLFLARASLKSDELMRMFKPGCSYKDAQLIYWASRKWESGEKEAPFLIKKERYIVDHEERYYAFFSA